MQQAHVHAPAKRLMPMIKLGEMLINPEGTKVHSLYIFSSNPAITAPDQNVVRRGLMRDDLFTVVHERFFTDTCSMLILFYQPQHLWSMMIFIILMVITQLGRVTN